MEILRYLSWAEDEGGMRRGVGIDGKGWRCGGERNTLSQQRRCVIFTLAHTKLVHNNCATCHGRHDRDCTIESGLARNNCQALRCDAGCVLNYMLMHTYCVKVTI